MGFVLCAVLVLLALALAYGIRFNGALHLRPGWGPTDATYSVAARRALWQSGGGVGEPAIRPMSPPVYAWRALGDFEPQSDRADLVLLYQLSRSAWPDPVPPGYPSQQASFAAVVDASHWPVDRVLDSLLDRMYFGQGMVGLRQAARGMFRRDADALDAAQLAVILLVARSPSYFDPWCHRERLRDYARQRAVAQPSGPAVRDVDAALASIAPRPVGHRCPGEGSRSFALP